MLARELRALGIDAIDVSSRGFDGATIDPKSLYQLPFSTRLRNEANIPTLAVGLITTPEEAEAIIANGDADLVSLARAALDDPNWPVHARLVLDRNESSYADWPLQAGYAIRNMDRSLGRRVFATT